MAATPREARPPRPAPRRRARVAVASAMAVALLALVLPAAYAARTAVPPASASSGAGAGREDPETVTSDPITLVQANLSKEMSTAKFRADTTAVFAERPDFVTFNEVYRRDAADLAPEGYAMFRTEGIRTGWAPVVWDATKWSAVATGTYQISWKAKRYRSTSRIVGVRFANWATLVNRAGRTVSLVSVHIAPKDKDTAQLLVPSLKRIQALAQQLSASGPVLIGGDFNMGRNSSRYHPEYLAAAGMVSTYDILGTSFPTHRRGGTIDYLYVGPSTNFTVEDHYPVVVNSDHRLVVAHLQLLSSVAPLPVFKAGKVVSNPRGSSAERLAIRSLMRKAIDAAAPGAVVHVASDRIRGRGIYRSLLRADDRGVKVTVITGEKPVTGAAAALRAALGANRHASSYYVSAPRAWASTSPTRTASSGLRPTMLMVSRAGGTPSLSILSNSNLSLEPLKPSYGRVSTARVSTALDAYDDRYRTYLASIGRSY